MTRRRRRYGIAALAVLALVAAGCSSSSTGGSSASGARSVVALGDSVPYGTNCDCAPYPPLTAEGLTVSSGRDVAATNDAVPGYTTANVLKQLESDTAVIDHVRKADAVEIEVGANDVAYTSACGTDVGCYAPKVPAIEQNLAAIVERVKALTAGRKVLLVLLDYWSVWLGGQYASAQGEAYVAAAETMTGDVNKVIRDTAASTGSAYVDLRAAFKGPDYAYDETHYLSSDGDHPNAAGHQKIAEAAQAVIESSLGL